MKILLFGKNGQIGWELNRSLLPLGKVIALGKEEADFSDPESLRKIVRNIGPDIIVNAAAYTAVDKAEDEEDLATIINGVAPGVLAEEAKKSNALFVHYSTDYVFDGKKEGKYVEQDEPNPVNAYGRSKYAGELAVQSLGSDYLIFRTSWIYSERGSNFLSSILRLAAERDELQIVNDQRGAPTWARYVADVSAEIIMQSVRNMFSTKFNSGIYNLVCDGEATWYEFACEIIKIMANIAHNYSLLECNINPVGSSEYKTKARRPLNSRMTIERIKNDFDIHECHWRDALVLCVSDISKDPRFMSVGVVV